MKTTAFPQAAVCGSGPPHKYGRPGELLSCDARGTTHRPVISSCRRQFSADPPLAPGFLKGPAGPLSRAPRLVCRLPGNSPLKNIFFQKSQGRKLLFLPVSAILPKPCPCFCAVSPKVCGGGAGIWRMGRAAWYYCYQKYFPAAPVLSLFCAPPCLIPAGIPARRSFGGSHREKKGSAKPQSGSRRPAVRMFTLLFSVGSLRQWYGRFFREM